MMKPRSCRLATSQATFSLVTGQKRNRISFSTKHTTAEIAAKDGRQASRQRHASASLGKRLLIKVMAFNDAKQFHLKTHHTEGHP
jgi:hypothetical protein